MELQDLKKLHEKEEKADGLDLTEIVRPYLHRWKQFMITFIVCLTIGIIYYFNTPKSYLVTSAIRLSEQSENGLGSISSQMSALNLFSGGNTNVDNELALMRSRTLIKKVVIDLNLYVTYKGMSGWKEEDIYLESPYIITAEEIEKIDKLKNSVDFKFKKIANTDEYLIKYTDNDEEKEIKIRGSKIEINTHDFGKLTISPREKTHWSKDFTATVVAPRIAAINFAEIFEISTTTKSSNVVTFALPTQNIDKATNFQKEILYYYNLQNENIKKLEANTTLTFVKERLSEISKELSVIEKDVEKYKLDNDILDLTLEAKASVEQNYETQIKLNEIETQKILLNYVSEYLSKQTNVETIIPSLSIMDEGLLIMISQHNKLVLLAQEIKTKAQDNNKSYQDLKLKLINSSLAIRESISSLQEGIKLSIAEFKKIGDDYQIKKNKMPIQEREFYDILRRQKMTEAIYLFLAQKCEESVMSLSIGMPKAYFIELPDAGKKHTAPRGSIVLMMIIAATLIFPISFHLCKDGIKSLKKTFNN